MPKGWRWKKQSRSIQSGENYPNDSDTRITLPHAMPGTRTEATSARSGSSPIMVIPLLLGFAIVARGEIALIVAQLTRPLLETTADVNEDRMASEPFAVVIWGILVSTVGGAVMVGMVLR